MVKLTENLYRGRYLRGFFFQLPFLGNRKCRVATVSLIQFLKCQMRILKPTHNLGKTRRKRHLNSGKICLDMHNFLRCILKISGGRPPGPCCKELGDNMLIFKFMCFFYHLATGDTGMYQADE